MQIYTLCTKDSCCPTVMIDENSVTLKDDFGGEMTAEKYELLKSVVFAAIEQTDDVINIEGKVKLLRSECDMLVRQHLL